MKSIVAAFLFLSLCPSQKDAATPKQEPAPAKKRPWGSFTISKETTFILEPIDKEGCVDYVAALNKHLSKGVTPENNANVLLWKAFGPHPSEDKIPAEFFQWMGMQTPPEEGDYLVSEAQYFRDYLNLGPSKEGEEAAAQFTRAEESPWKAKDYPKVQAWLKVNEKPLELVIQATKRSQFFSPRIPFATKYGPTRLMTAPQPAAYGPRNSASLLITRAFLRAGEGDFEGAWGDLLASHRLGRLVARGGTTIDGYQAMVIEKVTWRAELVFLSATRPDAERIKKYFRDLQTLPRRPLLADIMDVSERLGVLESILGTIRDVAADHRNRVDELQNVDLDPSLRSTNRWFDRLVEAMREQDAILRRRKLEKVGADLQALRKRPVDTFQEKRNAVPGAKQEPSQTWGDSLMGLGIYPQIKAQETWDRSQQEDDNLLLAFALAWYQRDKGRYPTTLDELSPKYLPRVPRDIFSGKPLIYRPREDGYLLCSVGANGEDDGGRSFDDKPPGDDLVIRMPVPAARPK